MLSLGVRVLGLPRSKGLVPLLLPFLVAIAPWVTSAQGVQVRWTQSKVNQSALIGTVSTVQITFVSQSSIPRVRVTVVPALAPYIAPIPSEFASVAANTPHTITLVVTIPNVAAPQTILGSINIVDGTDTRKTFARPLPVTLNIHAPSLTSIPAQFAHPSPDRIISEGGVTHVSNEILVVFRQDADLSQIQDVIGDAGGGFLGRFDGRVYQVAVPQASFDDLHRVATQLEANPSVDFATLNVAFDFFGQVEAGVDGEALTAAQALINLPKAWAAVKAEKKPTLDQCQTLAWDQKGPCIGIVDALFNVDHDDLKANYAEHDKASFYRATQFLTDKFQKNLFHGTAVASIAGGRANNGHGTNGVMRDTNLLLYEAPDALPNSTNFLLKYALSTDWYQAATSALDDGVRIVNMSEGKDCGDDKFCDDKELPTLEAWDKWFRYALLDARSIGRQVLWVLAAGNAGDPDRSHTSPARLSHFEDVISVAAVDGTGRMLSNSSSGDIAAPGSDLNTACAQPDFVGENTNCAGRDWVSYNGGVGGTSWAAPFVTGVAGLMLSVNPGLNAAALKEKLLSSANHVDHLPIPLLDACRAVKAAFNPQLPVTDPSAPKLDYPTGEQIPVSVGSDGKTKYDIAFRWDTDSLPKSCNALKDYEFSLTLDGTPYLQAEFCKAPRCLTGAVTTWSDVIRDPPKLAGWAWEVRAVDIYNNAGVVATGVFSLAPPAPVTARDDSYTMTQATTLNVPAPGLLANDTIPPALTANVEFLPPFPPGSLTNLGNGSGGFIFTPNASFTGTVTLRYLFHSPLGDSNVATVTITVNPVPSRNVTISSIDVPKNIPNPGQVVSTITVPNIGTILDVTASFSFTHQCERDLVMVVRHPDGTGNTVMDRGLERCSGVDSLFTSTSLTMQNMLGKPAAGVWTITITDDNALFSGQLNSWSLNFRVPQ
jgi:subtilisin family serine protease/subtilisin-like proprotein convertase family protein